MNAKVPIEIHISDKNPSVCGDFCRGLPDVQHRLCYIFTQHLRKYSHYKTEGGTYYRYFRCRECLDNEIKEL